MSVGDGAFRRGIEQFNRGEFFAAHETWEAIWLEACGRDKVFLQAIIQFAAAFHHWQRGNPRGTLALLRHAIAKLAGHPGAYRGIRVDLLREAGALWIEALTGGADMPAGPPTIELGAGSETDRGV